MILPPFLDINIKTPVPDMMSGTGAFPAVPPCLAEHTAHLNCLQDLLTYNGFPPAAQEPPYTVCITGFHHPGSLQISNRILFPSSQVFQLYPKIYQNAKILSIVLVFRIIFIVVIFRYLYLWFPSIFFFLKL